MQLHQPLEVLHAILTLQLTPSKLKVGKLL
jgi:hypothetical protein